jgi:Zn-dependent peptidase ImmA (M78 family)
MPADLLNQLLKTDPEGWSAVTCKSAGANTVIYNPQHSPQRQSSDIAHELAHIVLDHDPAQLILSQTGEMCMRSFNQREEAEANWLAGALLLPREALVVALQQQTPEVEVCKTYAISKKMLTWRYLVTGVGIQAQRAGSRIRKRGS